MKGKRVLSILSASIISLGLIGCGGSNTDNNVKIENKEEVVVATSVAVTEILDALGVDVAGVPSTSYELPESTKDAVEVGNPMSPDLEIIKSLNPSIVISVDTLGSDYISLFEENNIPSEFVSLTSLDGLKETIKNLGERFNKEDKSVEILAQLELKEEEVSKVENENKPNIMIVFAAPGSSMLATPSSYIGNLVELVGGNNVIQDDRSSFVTYSKEELSKLNPDKILVMVHAMPEETKAALEKEMESDTAWQSIQAVKDGNIVYLDSAYFGMSANLKVIEGLDILSDIVHNN